MEPTLLQQMQQVDTLQQKMTHYHQLYLHNLHQQLQSNEFLTLPPPQFNSKPYDPNQQILLFSSKQQEPPSPQPSEKSICESKIIPNYNQESQISKNDQEIRLSRIFEDIVLGSQITNNEMDFEIVLEIDRQSAPLKINNKNNLYSLSNFSSFNNNSQSRNSIEFRELLENIENQTGRTLTTRGVENIIKQIEESAKQLRTLQPEEPQETLRKLDNLKLLSERNFNFQEERHKFDNTLNNCAFHRSKPQKQSQSKNISFSKSQLLLERENKDKTSRCHSRNKTTLNGQPEEKENWKEQKSIQKNNPLLKQMKIVGKGGRQSVMHYNQPKHIEHYCILNKIYGKERDKILKAAQNHKTSVLLE